MVKSDKIFDLKKHEDLAYFKAFRKFLECDLNCDPDSFIFVLSHSSSYLLKLIDRKIATLITQITENNELEDQDMLKQLKKFLKIRSEVISNIKTLDYNMKNEVF